ncbi:MULTISPECIES: DUF881 domain-containing protein [unclassified Aeromicrobium]|uniref:DUF881 domain-containing protein n=1 Tax=unclassified Aeromicrobium TaxID=2633570 RepID=UPI0020978D77|nr:MULTISPECIES: DUF881 domain-containing protein [unclassified Aeromicrobium]MCO7239596.1 DUF881 domain-containing protein [Aeromicrobium sp. CnD17-E]MDR6119565.1 uncharacterized protein YlxW (UPF0749 family) [Aeromicrobium sp. SORGH_AS_0981]
MPDTERPHRAAPHRRAGSQVLVALLVGGLAFAMTVQVRQDDATDYGSLRGVELVELLKSVDVANERLAGQIDELTATRDRLRASRGDAAEAEDVARQRAEELAVLAGSVGATGPGVRLTVSDPDGLVDAGLVLDVLQELREAGAEAIVVNDTARVVAQTYVLDDEQGLRIGGRQVSSPYVFDVIGDPTTLEESITFRGGVRDLLQARGAQAAVARRSTITITALADVRTPEYARPDVGAP